MWTDFYKNGGWGMIPTTLFGFFLVASAVLLLLRPEKRYVPLVVCLGVLTACSGVLGTTTGMIKTFRYVAELAHEDQVAIAAIGCAESLNNLILAFMILVVATLLSSGAAVRALRKGSAG